MIKHEQKILWVALNREKKIQNDVETIILIAWWLTRCAKHINECELEVFNLLYWLNKVSSCLIDESMEKLFFQPQNLSVYFHLNI